MTRIAVFLLMLLLVPAVARAQTPESTPVDLATVVEEIVGGAAGSASASYESPSGSENLPSFISFGVVALESVAEAQSTFDAFAEYLKNDWSPELESEGTMSIETTEVTIAELDAERIAAVGTSSDAVPQSTGFVVVRYGQYLVAGAGETNTGDVIDWLTPYLAHMLQRLQGADVTDEMFLQSVIPTLNDLPPGYVVREQD